MTKGTPSMGRRSKNKTHIVCRRCGRHSYHATRKECSSCGFGATRSMRTYNWQNR